MIGEEIVSIACLGVFRAAGRLSNSQPAGSAAGPLPAQAAHSSHDANGSWMLAEAKSDDLVYVSDNYNGIVDVYEYGKSKQVGALRGFDEPTGQCVNHDGECLDRRILRV